MRSRPFGEADRLITLLTWERGKISAVARGARKVKSKLAAGVDLFTYGEYTLYRGRNLDTITGQSVKEYFPRFRASTQLYPYALHLAELADRLISGEEPCRESCQLLLAGWRLLAEGVDPELLCRAYELKLLALGGYRPGLDGCVACGSPEAGYFNAGHGGLLCGSCGGGIRLNAGTVALAGRLLATPLEKVKLIRYWPAQLMELAQITSAFLRYHLDIEELNAMRYIRENNPAYMDKSSRD